MATILIRRARCVSATSSSPGALSARCGRCSTSRGESLEEAGPSTPIEVLGLDGVPDAGDQVNAAEDDKVAKQVVEHRRQQERKRELGSNSDSRREH